MANPLAMESIRYELRMAETLVGQSIVKEIQPLAMTA